MKPIVYILLAVLRIYSYVMLATVVYSWLYSFGVINRSNQAVRTIGDILYRMTEPVLAPIRRVLDRLLPNLAGLDLSPLVAFLIIWFLEMEISLYILPYVP
jgi:YggT family protein